MVRAVVRAVVRGRGVGIALELVLLEVGRVGRGPSRARRRGLVEVVVLVVEIDGRELRASEARGRRAKPVPRRALLAHHRAERRDDSRGLVVVAFAVRVAEIGADAADVTAEETLARVEALVRERWTTPEDVLVDAFSMRTRYADGVAEEEKGRRMADEGTLRDVVRS